MKLLISLNEFDSHKLIPCECKTCKGIFHVKKSLARRGIKGTRKVDYCSSECKNTGKITKINTVCNNCGKEFLKKKSQFRSKNNFCNSSCSGYYNSQHKITGNRRSKLEKWIESNLSEIYPNLEILYSNRVKIKNELDIYIPCLNIAFEINGVIHYKPIYGSKKLSRIKNNDRKKTLSCIKSDIELFIINTSKQKYFKVENSQKYLDEILNIINSKLEPYKISQSSCIVTKDD